MQRILGEPPEEDVGRLALALAATAESLMLAGTSVILGCDESERLVAYETSNHNNADGIIDPSCGGVAAGCRCWVVVKEPDLDNDEEQYQADRYAIRLRNRDRGRKLNERSEG
jgi:hypothetical protein